MHVYNNRVSNNMSNDIKNSPIKKFKIILFANLFKYKKSIL